VRWRQLLVNLPDQQRHQVHQVHQVDSVVTLSRSLTPFD
jgi:hypothetical protein